MKKTEKEIIKILSNPKYWCPSKKQQWERMAKAIMERIKKDISLRLFKIIRKEEYKGEPVQYVGYYVLHHKDLDLPEPEVFFVEEDEK